MDHPYLFVTSIGSGVAVAAPVGPMALICIRRTLALGWRSGVATGAGVAIGDGIYAAVAAFGLVSISSFVLAHERLLHLLAGCFLVYLGLKTGFQAARSTPGSVLQAATPVAAPAWSACASAVLLTLTNPPTIIMFAALFTALAPRDGLDATAAATTVAGVVTGSLLWWISLVAIVTRVRHATGATTRRAIDVVAGAVLTIFGLFELGKAA